MAPFGRFKKDVMFDDPQVGVILVTLGCLKMSQYVPSIIGGLQLAGGNSQHDGREEHRGENRQFRMELAGVL